MKHYIFSIHDQKAEAFIAPFTLPKMAMAVRSFKHCVNSPEHQFGAHPQDFTLFVLGVFDDNTGKFDISTAPESLGNGVEFKNQEVNLDLFEHSTEELTDKEVPNHGHQTSISNEAPVLAGAQSGNSKEQL